MDLRTLTPGLLLAIAAAACGADRTTEPTTPPSTSADAQPSTSAEPTTPPSTSADPPASLDAAPTGLRADRLPVIVDYSPTSSDVAALMYVSQHPAADLLAVTLAGTGESHCEHGVANTRALLAAVGRADVPVACGQDEPLGPGNEWPADWRDAADRLGGLGLQATDAADGADGADAADLLASIAADDSPVTIIALGPLTNIAVATRRHGDLAQHVAGVVTMGGAVGVGGNATNGVAEWNYFIDPTAVDVVLRSGLPVTMVPLDATNRVPVTHAWFDELAGHRTTVAANVVHDLFAAIRPWELGTYFWDELAAAVALDDGAATLEQQTIVIELAGPEQGRTRIDPTGTPVRIAVDTDAARFERGLLTTLNGGTEPPDSPTPATATRMEVEYFRSVEASAAALGAAIEQLFQTPLARDVEAIAERGDAIPLEPDDEAVLREFFTTFWTDGSGHLAVLRDELERLDPPGAVRAEHDEYVAAVDAVVASTDERVADIGARDVAELRDVLWEPDEELAAMEAACEALGAGAARLGIDAETCPR